MSSIVRTTGQSETTSVFERWGARPVINGMGVYTDLGGAYISQGVWALMAEANAHSVDMVSLLEVTGRRIAQLVGCESARVVPGASAAIALATAACLTRGDGEAIERLPDTTGLKPFVVIQELHRYKYLRMAWMAGARIVFAGDERGTTAAQLDAALDPKTVAMFLFVGHRDGRNGTVPIAQAAEMARRKGIPTFVDAAFLNYPPSTMRRFTDAGADLVCYSAKYWYGPNSGGFLGGRRELIETIAQVDFTRFESGSVLRFGRAFKLDRFAVAGTVAALEEWFSMDHEARWASYARVVGAIGGALSGVAGVSARPRFFTMEETLEDSPTNCLEVRIDERLAGLSATDLHRTLADGNPRVLVHLLDGERLCIAVDAMVPGAEKVVAARLREACTGSG
jgi:D-glucosaminate-6-phosphate ammonia-lyase